MSGLVFPQISARRGRVWCLLVACGVTVVPLSLAAALNSLPLLLLAFLLSGFGQSGFENEAYVYLSEVSGEKFRNFSQVILSATWGFSQIILALIMQHSINWRVVISAFIACNIYINILIIYNSTNANINDSGIYIYL